MENNLISAILRVKRSRMKFCEEKIEGNENKRKISLHDNPIAYNDI